MIILRLLEERENIRDSDRISQEELREAKRQRFLAALPTLALILKEFGAQKVVVYGSILRHGRRFGERSDLDLLTLGLPLDQWHPALQALEQIKKIEDIEIDLKRAEELPANMVQLIIKSGQVI